MHHRTTAPAGKLRDIIRAYLLTLFPGSSIEGENLKFKKVSKRVAYYKNKSKIKISPYKNKNINVIIKRGQPFSQNDKLIMETFVDSMVEYIPPEQKPYERDILKALMIITISKCISEKYYDTIKGIINIYEEWSELTYEGKKIAHCVGIELKKSRVKEKISFQSASEHDFFKVISNGNDSIVVCDGNGHITRHDSIENKRCDDSVFSPFRFMKMAAWSSDKKKVVLSLTQNGEILIFKNKELVFAKRRGKWVHFSHEPIISQIANEYNKWDQLLRTNIYLTCLDVSFRKTGCCIGLIQRKFDSTVIKKLVSGEAIENKSVAKTKTINVLLNNTTDFNGISRQLRQELASIDGALLISSTGEVLTAGTILKISKSDLSGGGRTAAAMSIGKYGVGLKVSNDGYIKIYNDRMGDKGPIEFG